ncbi:helix-turn-helix domain-containing protein [Deinococcus geothermalis]|uniref:helix-turn-helix domain-containing protein n=1 Tax=Deinococcus geothermalis TaxID=68909 RepID=UPI002355F2F2|nr:helix-turn-helix transcriptional regulator [Deinococcus geothermalis]
MSSNNPWLTSTDAGHIIQKAREALGLTQDQVAEELGVDKSYISKLEGGKHHAGRSKYFPQLVRVLKLSAEQVAQLNPGAVVSDQLPSRSGPPVPPRLPPVETPLEIPPGLQEAIQRYSSVHPEFTVEKNLRAITSIHRYGGGADFTPEEWLDILMANRRWLVKP